MTAAPAIRLQPGENRFRVMPPPAPRELVAKTRPRPTDDELEEKLQACLTQYGQQVANGDSKESLMITLGQIGALQMVLGYTPSGDLPLSCIM